MSNILVFAFYGASISNFAIIRLEVNAMDYGARIKDLINDHDMKQKAFAAELGLSANILSNYITGRTTIPPEAMAGVASYFSVTADYLLGLTDDPLPPFPVTPEERAMINRFRSLTANQKELIVQTMELMEQQNRRG